MSWKRVTKQNPCPICEKDHHCSIALDGSVACCMRVPSDWECKGDMGGWIHKLNPDLVSRVRNVFRRTPKKKPLPPKYWHGLVTESQETAGLRPRAEVLGLQLGLSYKSLKRLLVGWLPEHSAWTFPMWDGKGRMIGIRLRGLNNQKWSITGSFNGIFWPTTVSRKATTRLIICEGPTDCAALLDLGFDAIGRPSNLAGTKYILEFLEGARRDVVIMADNDTKSRATWEGAIKLADVIKPLTASLNVLVPPSDYKDIRGWYQGGGTHEDLEKIL